MSKLGKIKSLRSTTIDTKSKEEQIPAGSVITKKDINIRVEEIENGFIVSKEFEIRYRAPKSNYDDSCYYTKKWYSETNPLELKTQDNKSLAEAFSD